MKYARDLSLMFAFVLGGSVAASSQSKSPETALEEIATADKLEALAHHLPLADELVAPSIRAKGRVAHGLLLI